ncbi:MAG TPA: carboxypeptidase-like regulatory domain-containing protein [Longimicrobiaceae bacterium]|jgi:hypothetical protein|nr:carboxypeptidase-like regulatory domain-containing protein [Longimicrobiaceae bacterium]
MRPYVRASLAAPVLLLLAVLAFARTAAAQQNGTVTGRAVAAEDGSPIALSLVKLAPAAGGETRTALTDTAGAFRFGDVPAGRYVLRVERIGFSTAPSAVFPVAEGQTVDQTLRSVSRAVVLAALTAVSGGPACYTGERLAQQPRLAALWAETRKAAETRREFEARYAYQSLLHFRAEGRIRALGPMLSERDTVLVLTPDSVRAHEARRRAMRETAGFVSQESGGINISVPDELELLEDDFLVGHCLFADPRPSGGQWALRFRPVRARRDRVDVSGTILIDTATFAVREVRFDYARGTRRVGHSLVRYAAVETPFGRVRLPSFGNVHSYPGAFRAVLLQGFDANLTYRSYSDFVRVPPESAPRTLEAALATPYIPAAT